MLEVSSIVEPDICNLVARLNTYGFRTYASCQGHGFPVDKLAPYVAFVSTIADAAELAQVLRQDSESLSPVLRWGWEITASFNSMFILCFRLNPTNPHRWYDRYCRHSLRHDFDGIVTLLKSGQVKPF